MDVTTITVADFKARFYRDFQYASVPSGAENAPPDPSYVQDQDITNAFGDAQALFNQGLFGTDAAITTAYLMLTAHFLCTTLRTATQGVSSQGTFPVTARAVGSVSETYGIPEDYLKSPILAEYTQTSYGLRYLAMALPRMIGNASGIYGGTHA